MGALAEAAAATNGCNDLGRRGNMDRNCGFCCHVDLLEHGLANDQGT